MTTVDMEARKAEMRRRRTWTRSLAFDLVAKLWPVLEEAGFSCALTGSLLLREESAHDLDLVVYPRDTSAVSSSPAEWESARAALVACGLQLRFDHDFVSEQWRKKGSKDVKYVDVWYVEDRRVDVMWLR
jgi:predicted nucleotidyltransferase